MPIEGNIQRCLWVDIAKGIAIIAVVLLHIDYPFGDCLLSFGGDGSALEVSGGSAVGEGGTKPNGGGSEGVFSIDILPLDLLLGNAWHIYVFFILGGFFLTDARLSSPSTFIPHKLKTLYLPLLYFSLPAALLHNVLLDIGWYSTAIDYGGKMMSEWSLGDMFKGVLQAVFLAGREPILGALWFLCSMLAALCGLSLVSSIVKGKRIAVMLAVLSLAALCSSLLINGFGVFIPRFNHALVAMLLIYLGYLLRNVWQCRFDDLRLALGSFAAFYVGVVMLRLLPFQSVFLQIAIALAALYVVCFVARRIEMSPVGRLLALCGRESLYVMALHFVAFRIATEVLNLVGGILSDDFFLSPAASEAPSGGSFLLLLVYLFAGIALPIVFIRLWRWTRNKVATGWE